jgi:aspartyl-tRNA(Asn)/glutamyl-tRNA(Gln) amidotransferase subunit A
MNDPACLSLAAAARAVRDHSLAAAELVAACLDRIELWQPRINAFVALERDPAGIAARPVAAGSGAAAGGFLRGVPLAHKDMFYRTGRVSNCGSSIRRGWIAEVTSTALSRLDAAGALQLGTLSMAEFAYGPTGQNDHWGDCRNPWNPAYISGGSSSGAGAAVAARLAFGALGSDTGGSVRIPAALCGVTGLKTTWGRVSRHGVMPLAPSLDTIGPLARSAEDCALLLAAIAGFDPQDPLSAREPVEDYPGALSPAGWRIALSRNWIERQAEPEVAARVLEAARVLQAFGARLVDVEPPDIDLLGAHCSIVLQAEASAQHARWMRERPSDYSAAVRSRLEAGFAVPAAAYLESLRLRSASLERFCGTTLEGADFYLLPATLVRVPTLEQTGPGGGAGMPRLLAELTRLTRWVNYLGLPALALPCGFDPHGMPVGMQLVGRPFAEAALLAAGHAFQQETDWHRRMPV